MRKLHSYLLCTGLLCLAATGCKRGPRVETRPSRPFIEMNDRSAMAYIVSDINDQMENGAWRWAHQRPTLRFKLKNTENLKLSMDFVIADATFQETGPLTLTYFVNSHEIDKVTYDKPGPQHYEKPVPAALLKTTTEVAVDVDKPYIAKRDGVKLGFILLRGGFVQ